MQFIIRPYYQNMSEVTLQSKCHACSPKNGVVMNAGVSVTVFDEIVRMVKNWSIWHYPAWATRRQLHIQAKKMKGESLFAKIGATRRAWVF